MDEARLSRILHDAAARINVPGFVADDPIQFPRRFSAPADIEIVSLLISTLSWGKRSMICRDCNRLLDIIGNSPLEWVMNRGDELLDPNMNIHRTFFARNLRHYVAGLRRIFSRFDTLEAFAANEKINHSEVPAWALAAALNREFAAANGGEGDSRCLPLNLDTSALKRLNMALRWLVRNDGIVDLGLWTLLKPSQLYIPLDVHVGNTARHFGLLTRKANDRKAAVELTETLRKFNPDDPTLLDFALFGLGVRNEIDTAAILPAK